jgi:DnaJ-class molecular chaperone
MSRVTPPDDTCELDAATFAAILMLDEQAADANLYARLDVPRDADRKAIKRAYFAIAAKFHPDRFFKKKLGKAQAPLERLFVRMTEAHDTLADKTRRAAYDATLPPLPRSRSIAPGRERAARRASPRGRACGRARASRCA